MAEMHGRKKPKTETVFKLEEEEEEEEEEEAEAEAEAEAEDEKSSSIDQKPPIALDPSDITRTRLRQRWELACVLNFLRVFKPLLTQLEILPEQIETALIMPNQHLSALHIALLKGIPPVSKNLSGSDAWVTVLCKKLAPWWPWVAEGDIPLKATHGEEISRYKELDPVTRLLLLKALCEIRAFQDDTVSYINDALKQGNEICTFRKDRIGGDGTGVAFWNDGDAIMGYRLYKEVTKVEFTPRKGKGRLTPPPTSYQWETLATNLEEFQQISDKLSSSEIVEEAAVAKVITNEIIPVLEGIQKKKEKAFKRQQKQVMLLNGYFNTYRLEGTRSCRSRKPVNYTFDEYDKTIDEAIQLNKKRKKAQDPKHGQKCMKHEGHQVNSNGDASNSGDMDHQINDGYGDGNDDAQDDGNDNDGDGTADDDEKFRGDVGGSDSGDKDYDDETDGTDNGENDNGYRRGDKESNISGTGTRRSRHSERNGHLSRGVRRSTRTGNAGHPDIKIRGRQKHGTHTTDSDSETGSDSNKESSIDVTSGGEKESSGVQEGYLDDSDGDGDGDE